MGFSILSGLEPRQSLPPWSCDTNHSLTRSPTAPRTAGPYAEHPERFFSLRNKERVFFPSHSFIRCHNSWSPRAYCTALRLSSVFKCTKFASTPHDPGIKPAHAAGKEFAGISLAAGTDFLMIVTLLRDSPALSSSSRSHGMMWHARSLGWRAEGRSEHKLWDSSFMYTQKVSPAFYFF